MTDRQTLYGLRVESEIDLHQDRATPAGQAPDVVVLRGPEVRTVEPPAGRVLVRLGDEHAPLYSMVERPAGGYLLRFTRACDVSVSPDLAVMTVCPHADAVAGLDSVLTTGAALAFQLYARRLHVLHASAVQTGDVSIAFVGRSGMGKSTTAALFAEAGVPVWDADAAVHALYDVGGDGAAAVAEVAPGAVVGGAVDRARLREAVAADPGLLARLEARVHGAATATEPE